MLPDSRDERSDCQKKYKNELKREIRYTIKLKNLLQSNKHARNLYDL